MTKFSILNGRLLVRAAGLFSVLFMCATAAAQEAQSHRVEPWTEALVSVAEFAPATNLFRQEGQWRLVRSGDMDRAELEYFDLSPATSATFELWCAPHADTGCIRFVRFTGVEQEPVRPAARPWDTGGIYSFMIRSDNVPELFAAALRLGWWAESLPIRFQFGTSDLRNVVLQGPHGINVAVYERVTPEFTGFPVGRMSQGFNSMRMVRDREAARNFYAEILGFDVLFDATNPPEEEAFSNLSIPYNYTTQVVRSASALYPRAGETGRVEVMQIDGFTGHDHAYRASPPNLGHLSVRYPVGDLAGYRAMLETRGVQVEYAAQDVTIGGIGTVDIFAVRDPDGSLTEFYGLSGSDGGEAE